MFSLRAPENLPAPVNSAADDFCPTPIRGGGLFFVSRRITPGVTCGMGDIYLTRLNPDSGWETPGIFAARAMVATDRDEQGPSYSPTSATTAVSSSSRRTAVAPVRSAARTSGRPRARA